MLDGHDEYTPGNNLDIDNAITKHSLPTCCILLTSRDRGELNELRPYMDLEAEITGFDPERVEEYITKYLESTKGCKQLMKMARNSKLITGKYYGILQVPIMLHMICVLYQRKVSLPKTMTGVISAIVERCPDWEEIRRSGQKTVEEMKVLLESALVKLGKVCWERLQQGNKDLIFTKVRNHCVSGIHLGLQSSQKVDMLNEYTLQDTYQRNALPFCLYKPYHAAWSVRIGAKMAEIVYTVLYSL